MQFALFCGGETLSIKFAVVLVSSGTGVRSLFRKFFYFLLSLQETRSNGDPTTARTGAKATEFLRLSDMSYNLLSLHGGKQMFS